MRVSILIKSGPARGRRMMLRAGQIAKFGRSDWADFSIPDDDQLDGVHFEIDCRSNRVWLKAVNASSKVSIGQQEVSEAELRHRDIVRAGNSEFEFDISVVQDVGASESADSLPHTKSPAPVDVSARAEYLELSEEAIDLAAGFTNFDQFGAELQTAGMWPDAILWRAFHANKQHAVAWACKIIRRYLPELNLNPKQTAAYELAAQWSEQASEELRLQALAAAEKLKFAGIGASVAIAVGWSGGSMAPQGFEPVPPDPRATARWVQAGLLGVIAAPSPSGYTKSYKSILDEAPMFFDPLEHGEA
jgi:pSer/pThr/pTyr-binding forkhead associated (FHA) protein